MNAFGTSYSQTSLQRAQKELVRYQEEIDVVRADLQECERRKVLSASFRFHSTASTIALTLNAALYCRKLQIKNSYKLNSSVSRNCEYLYPYSRYRTALVRLKENARVHVLYIKLLIDKGVAQRVCYRI